MTPFTTAPQQPVKSVGMWPCRKCVWAFKTEAKRDTHTVFCNPPPHLARVVRPLVATLDLPSAQAFVARWGGGPLAVWQAHQLARAPPPIPPSVIITPAASPRARVASSSRPRPALHPPSSAPRSQPRPAKRQRVAFAVEAEETMTVMRRARARSQSPEEASVWRTDEQKEEEEMEWVERECGLELEEEEEAEEGEMNVVDSWGMAVDGEK